MTNNTDIAEAAMDVEIVIVAYVNHVDCPHCGAAQMGFVNDPRGGACTCEDCEKPYKIPADAKVDLG